MLYDFGDEYLPIVPIAEEHLSEIESAEALLEYLNDLWQKQVRIERDIDDYETLKKKAQIKNKRELE